MNNIVYIDGNIFCGRLLSLFGIKAYRRVGQTLPKTSKVVTLQLPDGSCIGQFKINCWAESPGVLRSVAHFEIEAKNAQVAVIWTFTWANGWSDDEIIIVNRQKQISNHTSLDRWLDDLMREMED